MGMLNLEECCKTSKSIVGAVIDRAYSLHPTNTTNCLTLKYTRSDILAVDENPDCKLCHGCAGDRRIRRGRKNTLSSAELNRYAGQYANTEVEATFTIAAADSKLVLRRRSRPDIVMDPVYPDTFQGDLVGLVKFFRDAAGKITGFSIKTDGVRNIRFERMP